MTKNTNSLSDPTYISGMKKTGQILANILTELDGFIESKISSGLTKNDINSFLVEQMNQYNVVPLFLGHDAGAGPYPKESIVSINDEIVHAIPDDTHITNRDLISVDVGVRMGKYCSDATRTYSFSDNPQHKTLIDATETAFFRCCEIIKAGIDIFELGEIISQTATEYNLAVLRHLTGHGIGYELWEPPHIYQYPADHYVLPAGKTIAIEPIYAYGNGKMRTKSDKWTIVTADGSLSAQYENTVLVTETGCEVLSLKVELFR